MRRGNDPELRASGSTMLTQSTKSLLPRLEPAVRLAHSPFFKAMGPVSAAALAFSVGFGILAAMAWRFIPQFLYVFPTDVAGYVHLTHVATDRAVSACMLCLAVGILAGAAGAVASLYRRHYPLRRLK